MTTDDTDLSDVAAYFRQGEAEVMAEMRRIGAAAVDYAKRHGDYHDVTGRLRASNTFEATTDGLTLTNTAPYASAVEARGKDVISGAALWAEAELKRTFETNTPDDNDS